MAKYEYSLFGTATTVKVFKFNEFPKPGYTSRIKNTDYDKLYFGGKAWNIGYDLMKLGISVYPILAYSDNRFEEEFKRASREFDMPMDGICKSPKGDYDYLTCYILEDANKNHITVGGYYSGSHELDIEKITSDHVPIDDRFLSDSKMAILTCPKAGDLIPMFEAIKRSGLPMAFSMSYDTSVFNRDNLEPVLKEAKIIFANESEVNAIESLYGYSSITDLFNIGKTEIVIKTLGKRGCDIYEKTEDGFKKTFVEATRNYVDHVEAIGAGDAFVAGYLYGLSNGYGPIDCARLGNTMGSFIIESTGSVTSAPTEDQLLARYHERDDMAGR